MLFAAKICEFVPETVRDNSPVDPSSTPGRSTAPSLGARVRVNRVCVYCVRMCLSLPPAPPHNPASSLILILASWVVMKPISTIFM